MTDKVLTLVPKTKGEIEEDRALMVKTLRAAADALESGNLITVVMFTGDGQELDVSVFGDYAHAVALTHAMSTRLALDFTS